MRSRHRNAGPITTTWTKPIPAFRARHVLLREICCLAHCEPSLALMGVRERKMRGRQRWPRRCLAACFALPCATKVCANVAAAPGLSASCALRTRPHAAERKSIQLKLAALAHKSMQATVALPKLIGGAPLHCILRLALQPRGRDQEHGSHRASKLTDAPSNIGTTTRSASSHTCSPRVLTPEASGLDCCDLVARAISGT